MYVGIFKLNNNILGALFWMRNKNNKLKSRKCQEYLL